MLQVGNLQHIFSNIKEERELWTDKGQNQTSKAAHVGHRCLDCALCFETHQRKSVFCKKNHDMTSISPHFPSFAVPKRKGKCGFSEALFQRNIHTMNKSEKYIFQIPLKPSCLGPGLLIWFCGAARGPEGRSGLQPGGKWSSVCLLCKEPPPESRSETKNLLCDRFSVTSLAFVIATKEHTSKVSP